MPKAFFEEKKSIFGKGLSVTTTISYDYDQLRLTTMISYDYDQLRLTTR